MPRPLPGSVSGGAMSFLGCVDTTDSLVPCKNIEGVVYMKPHPHTLASHLSHTHHCNTSSAAKGGLGTRLGVLS